jgi:hypothetical protein
MQSVNDRCVEGGKEVKTGINNKPAVTAIAPFFLKQTCQRPAFHRRTWFRLATLAVAFSIHSRASINIAMRLDTGEVKVVVASS